MTANAPLVHIFGIRHHGPGSARSLLRALETVQPDAILVEGPPDADDVLPLVVHPEMRPPVAILVYVVDKPHHAVFYPFAEFSPEWQALRFGLKHAIPVRFMDLPQSHQLALAIQDEDKAGEDPPANGRQAQRCEESPGIAEDPLGRLAQAAGFSDGERWWEHLVEERQNSIDLFAGISEAMAALREDASGDADPARAERESLREAWMRKAIRAAQKDGFRNLAVVCGAWHAPALRDLSAAKRDNAILNGLPKVKVLATWTPWTHGRLSYLSGYGAGIESPGWYEHLWQSPEAEGGPPTLSAVGWLTRVARLLREEDYDASSANVIDAVRLAEALAPLRGRQAPGLQEMNEATQTVLCAGDALPMALIYTKLAVGERLGHAPAETPSVPLQQDLMRAQKSLRLKPTTEDRVLDLDLRAENDIARSHLLHRLNLLGIPWGVLQGTQLKVKGTFHEIWRVQWQPEFAVNVIEAAIWGATVFDAASARACDCLDTAPSLADVTNLIDLVLLADLHGVVPHAVARLQEMAAVASEATQIMDALPPLANVLRYGNVRKTDTGLIAHVVDGLMARVFIGLPGACASLDDDAAEEMYARLVNMDTIVVQLRNEEHVQSWRQVLAQLLDRSGIHGLVAGRCCRLLLEATALDGQEATRRLGLALSRSVEPQSAGAWLEGFLRGSGFVLLHDEQMLAILDLWVAALTPERFQTILPLLRRAFASFPPPERIRIGEYLKRDLKATPIDKLEEEDDSFNQAAAEAALPLVLRLLGL